MFKKWLRVLSLAAASALMGLSASAQSFYTDRAVATAVVNSSGTATLVPIPYGSVRVCGPLPGVSGSPCTPVASITDINGAPLTVVGGNFGQIVTDVVGRFTFGCTPGSYQIQVAASASNTPTLSYPVTCPSAVASPTADAFYARLDSANQPFTGTVSSSGGDFFIASTQSLKWGSVGLTVPDTFLNRSSLGTLKLGKTAGAQDGTLALDVVQLNTGSNILWGLNTNLSRISNGVVGVGNGTPGNSSGTIQAASIANGTVTDPVQNLALKVVSADHLIYLSTNGNDSNDGLSWGTAKLTPQAAFNAATNSGANPGSIMVASGSYACPTTWFSGMSVIADTYAYPANFPGSFSVTNGSLFDGVKFSCTSANHTIDTVNNIVLAGIFFDFNNSGFGLILRGVQASKFYSWGVNLAGTTATAAIAMIPGTAGPANNTAFNNFFDTAIVTLNAVNSADCLTFIGTGAANAGPSVTDNEFHALTCTGRIRNGIRFELNSDTNKFYGVEINNTAAATGDVLVFNSVTPAADQDADNEILHGVCFTGNFNNKISSGTSFGNQIEMCSGGGEATFNILGGNPDRNNEIFTSGLFGVTPTRAVAKLRIQSGMTQGSGFKHQRFGASCATAAAIGATCTTNYNWTAAFPDNNYTWGCTPGAVNGGVPIINSVIQQAAGAGLTIQVVAITAVAASYTGVNCWAFHD